MSALRSPGCLIASPREPTPIGAGSAVGTGTSRAAEAAEALAQGLAHFQAGRLADAAKYLQHAAQRAPECVEAHGYLAAVLSSQGEHAASASAYQAVLRLRPRFPEALCNLGNEWLSLARLSEAEATLLQCIEIRSEFPEAWNSLGVARKALGRLGEAEVAFRTAVAQRPTYVEANYNLGNVLQARGCLPEAIAVYREVLRKAPMHADAWSNLGGALVELGRAMEGETACRQALEINAKHDGARCNLGNALLALDREEEAIACQRQVLAQDPRHAGALCGLGNAYLQLNRAEEALAVFHEAVNAKPDVPDLLFNEAIARLLLGDLKEGFRLYESRLLCKSTSIRREFCAPRLQPGMPVAGKAVLLYPEQGLGDTIQFVRYVPMLLMQGARVILEVQSALLPLMSPNFPDVLVRPKGTVETGYDLHCPLLSLPFVFGTTTDTIPTPEGYLRAEPGKTAAWRERLAADPRPHIGVVWSGNPKHKNDRRRSLPLATMRALLTELEGTFYSLQKDPRETPVERQKLWPELRDYTDSLADFSDTAALIAGLDLIVSVDTSVVHLAGALGQRTWVLLPFAPDWRWELGRDDSPWYWRMRLFRQPQRGQLWLPRFAQIAQAV
jgi:tetratricopeptide (TPR) repeat protein